MPMNRILLSLSIVTVAAAPAAEIGPIPEDWDYAPAMRDVAARFTGTEGVVLHIGDSITHANPYSQWARYGKGKTPRDVAICRWMHTGANDATDGWYLCSVDRP